MMTGSSQGKDGKLIATVLVALMALSAIPMIPASAEDIGNPMHLQAQDIAAVFDISTELTTITWRNIDSPGAELNNIFDAVYKLYRHTEQINSSNVGDAELIHQVDVCNPSQILGSSSRYDCMAYNGTHPGHNYSYLVAPGTNDTFYYGISTTIDTIGTYEDFISNESSLFTPVSEITTPIRTPYNLQASFDSSTSVTSLNWVNLNDLFPLLPEVGPNAYSTHIWKSDQPLTRETATSLMSPLTPVANLTAGISAYQMDIAPGTNADVYYSITYFLPNWNGAGQHYEDIRFLSNNALKLPISEDNLPPPPVASITTTFISDSSTGGGKTVISWSDISSETGESYAIYSSGSTFNNTTLFGPTIISVVPEGLNSYDHTLPIGRLGYTTYCVVVVDENGIFDTFIKPQSCSTEYENAFFNWIAEPTKVSAEFIGNQTTRVSWEDQLGAEGEVYHIWRSDYRVTSSQFLENSTVYWMASVPDGVQTVDIIIPPEVNRNSFYFVTSEALYQQTNGTFHYTGLVQNWDGAIEEITITPAAPIINSLTVDGQSNKIMIEWLNNVQVEFETYSVWRHFGSPFGENEDETSVINTDNGWELYESGIYDSGASWNSHTFSRNYDIPANVERNAWYSVTVSDIYGNTNLEAFPGSGGNAMMVKEDTTLPEATYKMYDGDDSQYPSPSLTSGSYKIIVSVNEYLFTRPLIEITTDSGGVITGGQKQMLLYADNLLDSDKGPEYYLTFDIISSVSAGTIVMNITLIDESSNGHNLIWEDRSLDAQRPVLDIYSPASSSDGSKYLYGNSIQLLAGASDDVQILIFQYKFTYNYGSGSATSSPWTTPNQLQDLYGDNSSLVLDESINSGNFESGQHAVTFRAVDTAGNEVMSQVIFVVDNCRNRLDGTTVCNYEESLKPEPEPVIVNPSYSDPPYVFVWALSGVVLISILIMLLVIRTSLRGPKKKSNEESEDDDWMSEFIGTSSEVDMDAITQTQPVEKEIPDIEEEEEDDDEDPFAVNIATRKSRKKKAPATPEPEEEEEDDDELFFGIDDDEEEAKPKRRQVGRRTAPKNAPKRKVSRRKKIED